ncbi:protein of unknown function (plasmid) [Azospirillum baldaniorum]|uniref:Uncharacterized protein n=1 Tax=Azospirillum baldaniorum TaxID=1064539 RepID=A0A9P1NPF4_9PROT|nr:protein of unknown function [Azospirillum baldaniorum]
MPEEERRVGALIVMDFPPTPRTTYTHPNHKV